LVQDIRELATEAQVAILWATHLVDEVEYADRVILIRDGQVVADGTPNELKDMAGTADLTDAYAALVGTSENG